MDSFEASNRVEYNLYSEGIRARLSAMPLLLEELEGSDSPVVLVTSVEVETKHRSEGFGSRLLKKLALLLIESASSSFFQLSQMDQKTLFLQMICSTGILATDLSAIGTTSILEFDFPVKG